MHKPDALRRQWRDCWPIEGGDSIHPAQLHGQCWPDSGTAGRAVLGMAACHLKLLQDITALLAMAGQWLALNPC
jgi:hypothetical protein